MRSFRVLMLIALLCTASIAGANAAVAAPPTLTVPFDYDTTVAGVPLTVNGTFTLTDVNTTTTNVTVVGTLTGTATFDGVTVSVNDTVRAVFTPVCGETQSSLTVDIGAFDVTINGFTQTVDPGSFTVTVATSSRYGGLICALVDALADGGNVQSINRLVQFGIAAA